jgi:hypothetical protein
MCVCRHVADMFVCAQTCPRRQRDFSVMNVCCVIHVCVCADVSKEDRETLEMENMALLDELETELEAVIHVCVIHVCVIHVCVIHVCVIHVCVIHVCVIHVCVIHVWVILAR